MRGDVHKRLYLEPLSLYSTVVQWSTVRLIFILQCIFGLQSQSIDFINAFYQEYISSEKSVFIEITGYFKSDGGQCDVVVMLKKILYGQSKAAHLWY